jgi:uncharacterized repeat protein (TIGR01451 family)
VLDSVQPLRVMLAWTDPPGSLSAQKKLVNDLDLIVTGPGGKVYWGNGAAGGDRLNNVEGIVIDHPPAGQYRIEVRGYNVPISSQPYALVAAGSLGGTATLSLTKHADPPLEVVRGGLITYTLALSAGQSIAQSLTLTDTLPLHTSFVSASDGGTLSGSVITWTIPSLAAGATVTRTLVAHVDPITGDDAAIVNVRYGAFDGTNPPVDGQPVSVALKSAVSASERKVYLPLVAR